MANIRDEPAQQPNSQRPTLSESNEAIAESEQGRFFTINHSVQPIIQFPDQLQQELPNANAEQTHNRIEPLPAPLPEVEVTEPYIAQHVTLTEEELSEIVAMDQELGGTLPDDPMQSGLTPEQEGELLSVLTDITRQYSANRSTN